MKRLLALLILLSTNAHADQTWNLRTSPLGLVGGEANLRVDYRIANKWMLGPEVSYINRNINGIDERAMAVGLFTVYHFTQAFEDGAYIDLGVTQAKESAKKPSGESASYNNTSIRLLAGYHWFWQLFNLNVGAGVASNSAGKVVIKDGQGKEVDHVDVRPIHLALDFSLGLAF